MTEPIFHLAEPGDWAQSTDTYSAPSVDEEGFIHCSTAAQLPHVARNLYNGHNGLVLLTIDPDDLDEETLIYEDLYGTGEEFPHVYGPLPTTAVLSTGPYLAHLEEGFWLDTRWNRGWMDRILHPDFAEVGRSGNSYDRLQTLDRPEGKLETDLPLEDYRVELVDEDVALVRYVSRARYDGTDRPAQRTSVWVNTNDGWLLRFHQGTPLP